MSVRTTQDHPTRDSGPGAGSGSGQARIAAVLMSELAATDGAGRLGRLIRGLVVRLAELDGIQAAAVAVRPGQAALVDEGWTGQEPVCLTIEEPGAEPMAGAWQPDTIGGSDTQPGSSECGQGIPGFGWPWPSTVGHAVGPDRNTHWARYTCGTHGQPLLFFFVVFEADPTGFGETVQDLEDVRIVLNGVLQLWAETAALRTELGQVDGEKHALTRLNRLQGRFVAMASHEFKTPLTSITAYADVLKGQITDEQFPHATEFLDVIRNEANRLLRMVNRILDFTRSEYGAILMTRKPVEMEPLVRETVRTLRPGMADKNLVVDVQAEPDLPRAEVDPDLIRQVLVNLLGNAVKFTPSGGRITIRLTEMESAIAVNVEDDGPGIPPEDIRRIFREFYRAEGSTAQEEGTGLGLSIARHIVHLHGGHIEVARRPEGGSDFRFLVPKEAGAFAPVSGVLKVAVDAADSKRLIESLLRLIAELTGSRAVALLLRDGQGALVPVGAMGMETEDGQILPVIETENWTRFLARGLATSDPGSMVRDLDWGTGSGNAARERMYAPLGRGDDILGFLVTGRRSSGGAYDAADLDQLTVLAEIVRTALVRIESGPGRITEGVRLLLQIRRSGIPTSTPEALHLVAKLGERLGIGETDIRRLQYAATLHDAGMARVEDEIVMGDSELSYDERDEVDRHVEQGVDLMGPLLPDKVTGDIIRHHHERFDGTGYPEGRKQDEIPLGSRLLAVIDAWFALTRGRPFRDGKAPDAALAELQANAGTQFDPQVVDIFAQLLATEGLLDSGDGPEVPTGN